MMRPNLAPILGKSQQGSNADRFYDVSDCQSDNSCEPFTRYGNVSSMKIGIMLHRCGQRGDGVLV